MGKNSEKQIDLGIVENDVTATTEVVLNGLNTDATVDAAVDATATADVVAEDLVSVVFLLSPTGKYNLAYCVGEVAEINVNQAEELVLAKYAEYVK